MRPGPDRLQSLFALFGLGGGTDVADAFVVGVVAETTPQACSPVIRQSAAVQ